LRLASSCSRHCRAVSTNTLSRCVECGDPMAPYCDVISWLAGRLPPTTAKIGPFLRLLSTVPFTGIYFRALSLHPESAM
jgi:hypothetical protein